MAVEPGKIRNVAVVGHRGTGKTSLVEAMLYQSGATNRLGTVEPDSTVPSRFVAPAWKSIASTSDVFPVPR